MKEEMVTDGDRWGGRPVRPRPRAAPNLRPGRHPLGLVSCSSQGISSGNNTVTSLKLLYLVDHDYDT